LTYSMLLIIPINFILDTVSMVCDFERAIWAGLHAVAPWVKICGCIFHWSRAVDNHITAKGLKPLREASTTFSKGVKLLKALAYCPKSSIIRAYKEVVEFFAVNKEVSCTIDFL